MKTYASIDVDCVSITARPPLELPSGKPSERMHEVRFWRRIGGTTVGDYVFVLPEDHGFVVGGHYKLEILGVPA